LTQKKIHYEFGKHAFSDEGIVSASVAKRLEDIDGFLKRKDIDAIWALRGGYGSIQLLDTFDYSLL
ncbi:LD-carboxypeptidase, partial [Candidatus Saccharibacteria bacterium]|nr:LD-carboxypeptidase [Candidatus Saccharibacteria bacterium]NIV03639.1 LD-carboxypeptidase [Calditrichia bacterium]NIV71931.1 LD-carboxypeptidase [Calditrichia bacterium]NIV98710.1 LD-carboxypeptidase [Candidatus Saccharibacteria bacterium]NIW78959.1 LD-carboxypeptidase [Calditrichia bacterium]